MRTIRTTFAFVAILLAAAVAEAGTPRLTKLSPPGGQRGSTVEVEFTGRGLDQSRDVLFYQPGITVESIAPVESVTGPNGKAQPVDPGTRVRVKLKVAADCPLG